MLIKTKKLFYKKFLRQKRFYYVIKLLNNIIHQINIYFIIKNNNFGIK